MDGINNFRIKFDKAVDYIPVASFINNSIDLIQRHRFSHKSEANLSDYQQYIVSKTKPECLVKMIPFGAIFWRIFHKEDADVPALYEKPNSSTDTDDSSLSQDESTASTQDDDESSIRSSSSKSFTATKEDSESPIKMEQSSSSSSSVVAAEDNEALEIFGHTIEELYLLPMDQLKAFLSSKNEQMQTPLEDQSNLKVLLPIILKTLSSKDLKKLLTQDLWDKLDQNTIESLSKQQCLRLTALLPFSMPTRLRNIWPEYAKDYHKILKDSDMYSSNNDIFNPYKPIELIENIPGLTEEECLDAIAHYIEAKKVPIKTISKRVELIMALAPHLRYVDLFFSFIPDLEKLEFLKLCSNVNILNCGHNSEIITLPDEMAQLQELYCGSTSITHLSTKLPQLKLLNCSFSSQLISITAIMPQLKWLHCESCEELTTLPSEMPQLKRLDCEHCSKLAALPSAMPQLYDLSCKCCSKLTTLPSVMPQLEYLDCQHCFRIISIITEMPLLKNFNCSDCRQLTTLPTEMAQLAIFDCNDCNDLVLINTEMPQLKKLDCSKCFSLTTLPSVIPQIQSLNCSLCPQLGSITAIMPQLKTLDCRSCKVLRTITAEMPKLTTLFSHSCRELLEITAEMPKLETFHCSYCPQLSILPAALPQCTYLNYSNSPNIRELPQLPFGARIVNENAAEFSSFNVNVQKFTASPRELLCDLGRFLLGNQPFPNVIYYNRDGSRNEVIDAGGVRRDCVTKLLENLFKKEFLDNFLKITDDFMPQARLAVPNEKEAYQTLGILLAYCFTERSGFKSGPLFGEDFYKFLLAPYEINSDSWFLHNMLQGKLSDDLVSYLINDQESLPLLAKDDIANLAVYFTPKDDAVLTSDYIQANREEVRKDLLGQAKEDMSLQAVSWIAEQLQGKLGNDQWAVLRAMTPSGLKDRIEGILTLEALKNSLEWEFTPTVTEGDRVKTQNFLLAWLDKNSDINRLSLFVRAVTGNKTLNGDPLKMDIGQRGKDFIPNAHTCYNSLDLTSQCESQEQFDAKLEILLEQTMSEEGFTTV